MVELEAEKYKNGLHTDFYLKSKNDDRRLGFGKHFLLFSIAESNVENYLYRRVSKHFEFLDLETLFPTSHRINTKTKIEIRNTIKVN